MPILQAIQQSGSIPHNHLARALMPRQPYSEAVKSDEEERFPLLP